MSAFTLVLNEEDERRAEAMAKAFYSRGLAICHLDCGKRYVTKHAHYKSHLLKSLAHVYCPCGCVVSTLEQIKRHRNDRCEVRILVFLIYP